MPKRQPKPEVITPDEVMDSPALGGFDAFLRYRPGEAGLGPVRPGPDTGFPQSPMGETPIGEHARKEASQTIFPQRHSARETILPTGNSPVGITPVGNLAHAQIAVVYPPRRVRRTVKIQDAHSTGEQALYQALWNAAAPETPDSRLIRIGYGGMQSLCGLDKSNCKNNILSLIKKLAVEVISSFDIRRNAGSTYRVFSYVAILKRRKAAGLEWVVRTRGVQFVEQPPMGEVPIGNDNSPIGGSPIAPGGDAPRGAVGETPVGPVGKAPIASRSGIKLQEAEPPSSPLVEQALRRYSEVVDDAGIRQLQANCRVQAPDCTEEEIAYFIRAKAEQVRSGQVAVRNLMGFLQTAVPRCFEGSAFREFRAERESERQQRLAAEDETARLLAEQTAVLADPNAMEEGKRFARQILGIPEPGEGRRDR